jgi:hypothetical protein
MVLLLGPGFCEVVASQHGGNGYADGFAVQRFEIVAGATAAGSMVNVAPVDGNTGGPTFVSMIFSSVTQPGVTTVKTVPADGAESEPQPAGFQLGTPSVYYEIETTARSAFDTRTVNSRTRRRYDCCTGTRTTGKTSLQVTTPL